MAGRAGDLLFQIVFQARLAQEQGQFDIEAVARSIEEKMIRRHPHVFGPRAELLSPELSSPELSSPELSSPELSSPELSSPEPSRQGGAEDWELRKREERRLKQARASVLDGIPSTQPALLEAWRMTEKASRVGFDWPSLEGVQDKLQEELAELQEALTEQAPEAIEHELGDVLFSVVNMARFLGLNPEDALKKANRRFKGRFQRMEEQLLAQGQRPEEVSLETLEALWQAAKRLEKDASTKPGTP